MPEQTVTPQGGVCEECGCSLCPLSIPHTRRMCYKCGKATYVCERGEKGGIVVRTGDQFTIPEEYLRPSLDPEAKSVLTRHGIPWIVQLLFSRGEVNSPEQIGLTLDSYIAEGEGVLRNSALLAHLDLDDETQGADVWKLLEQNQGKPEWWAGSVIVLAGEVKRSLQENDASRTAWLMSKLATYRAMVLFHRELEQHVWHGYTSAQLRNVLTLWKSHEENADEEFWQRTMAANALILSQLFSFPTVILKGKAYVGGKGIDNTGARLLDFLLVNQLTNNTALVEIKTPVTPLQGREYRAGVFPASADLSGAITQVLLYKDSLMKDYHTLASHSQKGFNALDPPCMVIAGNFRKTITTPERHASFDLFRHSFKGVEIVTYDEVFEKIEGLLKLLGI